NAHVIIEQPPLPEGESVAAPRDDGATAWVLSARSERALANQARRLLAWGGVSGARGAVGGQSGQAVAGACGRRHGSERGGRGLVVGDDAVGIRPSGRRGWWPPRRQTGGGLGGARAVEAVA